MTESESTVHAPIVDWITTPLTSDYAGHYVKIIDDVFSPSECASLLALATSDAEWAQAAVHYGLGPDENYVDKDYRNSERILRFDREAAGALDRKLRPYVREVERIQPGSEWERMIGREVDGGVEYGGRWELGVCWEVHAQYLILILNSHRLNERLSFLKYSPGHFFGPHCDGPLELPDGRHAGLTVQIYLGDEGVEGGATRLYGYDDRVFDVEPKRGRVLIFQQKNVYHSGEEVTKGVKYTLRSDFMFRLVDEA